MRKLKNDSTPASNISYLSNEEQQHVKELESITKIVQQKHIDRDRLLALKYYLSNHTMQDPSVVNLHQLPLTF